MEKDFITLSCPSCGGKLEITRDIDRFACRYCGAEHIVKRGGGIVSLKPVLESIQGVKLGVDRTAAELAIPRLEREIAELTATCRTLESGYSHSIQGAIVGVLIGSLLSFLFDIDFVLLNVLFAAAGFYIGDRVRARKNKLKIASIKNEIEQKQNRLAEHKSLV